MKVARRVQWNRGLTLIELVISIGILVILFGLVTLNLNGTQHSATLVTTVDVFLTDLSHQQLKAMVGDTEGAGSLVTYGIHFDSGKYTLFRGAYDSLATSNFAVTLPTTQQITTTFPSNEVVFDKGSGEVTCFINATCDSTTSKVTFKDSTTGEQKTIQLNKYGVVTGVN